jgi:hypothetical protein
MTCIGTALAAHSNSLPGMWSFAGQGQGRQDQIVPAQDDDLPFVLDVEDAFRITGRGTVIMGSSSRGPCISVITSN